MAKICQHCFVSGTVQGVFYRQTTKEQALNLELTGWVRNLPDGRVEVLICGEEATVSQMIEWLKVGPPRAKVIGVEIENVIYEEHKEFEIMH